MQYCIMLRALLKYGIIRLFLRQKLSASLAFLHRQQNAFG